MEYQTIDIHESVNEEKLNQYLRGKSAISLPNGTTSDHKEEVLEVRSTQELSEEQLSEEAWSGQDDHGDENSEVNVSQHQQNFQAEVSDEYSLRLIERGLEEWRQLAREEGRTSSICIFRLPHCLIGTNIKAEEPELVSIGPYHRGKDHLLTFEKHKWYFLDVIISRSHYADLNDFLRQVRALEERTRACYSDLVLMSSHDFVEMMLLDSCFVVGLLRHLGSSKDSVDEDDPIFTKPWIIPILIRDLLKLENQLPMFLLETVFNMPLHSEDIDDTLKVLALKVFDLICTMPSERVDSLKPLNLPKSVSLKPLHLLDLLHMSLLPSDQEAKAQCIEGYRLSTQSIQCVTQLRPSGIKFKPRKSECLLDIKFHKRVLEIPAITVNDFTSTLLLNCVAWEQCQEDKSRYFTDYVSFMNCLINQPRDVAFLCLDGIITRFSQDDIYVANFFNNLGKNAVVNVHNCYLANQFKELDSYFNSYWGTMMRTYFRSPWSIISVFSAFIIIVLSFIQTIMAVLSYQRQFG